MHSVGKWVLLLYSHALNHVPCVLVSNAVSWCCFKGRFRLAMQADIYILIFNQDDSVVRSLRIDPICKWFESLIC